MNQELQDTLLEFAMNYLLEHPENVMTYGEKYFKRIQSSRKTVIVYDMAMTPSESSEEASEEDIDIPQPRGNRRIAVSGESYDPRKVLEDFEKPVYEKTEEEMETLRDVAKRTLLFRNLDEEQLLDILNAMFKRIVVPGDTIIRQGDDGDNFYIIEQGLFDVYQSSEPDKEPQHIHTYNNCGFFGELALLYNQPRAATVIAASEGVIWALDRKTFRHIVVQAAIEKRMRYEEFIETVPILENLSPYEKNMIVDALVPKKFKDEEEIYVRGDDADGIYFVEEGIVRLTVKNTFKQDMEIMRMEPGEYFGETSLLVDRPRRECAIAIGEVKLAFLDSEAFRTILEPCMELIRENAMQREKMIKDMSRSAMSVLTSQHSVTFREDDAPPAYSRPARRIAVSGESYDPKKALMEAFIKPVHSKTEEEMETLREVAANTLLFRSLDEEQLTDVINAMFKRHVQPEEVIIQQGDDGDNFYVIEKGIYNVYMARPGKEAEHIHTYKDSGFFGELALLYNQPRAATVTAVTEGIIWALDRNTFRNIVVQSAIERRTKYEDFIENVSILKDLSGYEKTTLVDSFQSKKFHDGDVVFKEGDPPDGLYFIEEGTISLQVKNMQEQLTEVSKVKEYQHFGEAAVVLDKARLETAVAEGEVKVAFVDADTVKNILSPCIEALKSFASGYMKQIVDLTGKVIL